MTAMETRICPALEEWTKVFPSQMTQSYTSSVTFIKQLTIVAVSTITYLKNVLHEDSYTEDHFGRMKIIVLKDKSQDELAQFIITALKQAFDAFDKRYLQKLALCFYEESCSADSPLECYEFEYTYNPEGASVRVSSGGAAYTFEAIRDRTQHLLRACMVMMQYQTELPTTFDVGLRLYYNEAAPEDYQAPGFYPDRPEDDDVLLQTARSRVKIGGVRTPFHTLKLQKYQRETRGTSASCEPQVSQTPASQLDEPESEAGAVRCVCGRADRPYYTALVVCRHCGYRQHAACYGLRMGGGPDVPSATHCCLPCAERTGDRVDPGLAGVSNRMSFAMFRRALWWLAQGETDASGSPGRVQALCGRALAAALGIGAASAVKLLHVLRAQQLLAQDPPTDDSTTVEVVTEKLDSLLQGYFVPEPEEDDVASRLVEESLSQRSNSDPLSDVLTPLERVSIQTAPKVDVPAQSQAMQVEPSLDHYRSALGGAVEALPPPPKARKRGATSQARTGVCKKFRDSRR